jgi:hypothetical protein
MAKEFRHCTAFIIGQWEFPVKSKTKNRTEVEAIFSEMRSKAPKSAAKLGFYDDMMEKYKHIFSPNATRRTKQPTEGGNYFPFKTVSSSLYTLMLHIIMMMIDARFSLLGAGPAAQWRRYYKKHRLKVDEHVKYVMICNMHVAAGMLLDDYITKDPSNKQAVSKGEPTGVVQKKHLYRSCAALYTAAIVYDSIRIFHHYVTHSTDEDNRPDGFEVLRNSLPDFWKFIVVECANHGVKGSHKPNDEYATTPFMSVFGLHGLGNSGAGIAANKDDIAPIYCNWLLKAINHVSRIWVPKDGRFMMFVHRVIFNHDSTQRDDFAHKFCNICRDPGANKDTCIVQHLLPKLLRIADEVLVTRTTREKLISSIRCSRHVYVSAPSNIVKQLPTANRIHAVQMFLRMAQIFNEDVQTVAIKTAIRMELQNLYTDKQPFGKPK